MALKQLSIILIFTILSPLSNAQCTNNEFRLYPLPGGQTNEGMVQRCDDQTWRAVCGRFWDCRDAGVLCRQLGFPSSNDNGLVTTLSLSEIPWADGIDTSRTYSCTGSQNSLADCGSSGRCSGFFSTRAARAWCKSGCTQGNVRLVGGENRRLEICSDGVWSPICNLGYNEAAIACRQLGFTEFPRIIVDANSNNVNVTIPRSIRSVSCSQRGSESGLADCTINRVSPCVNPYLTSSCNSGGLINLQCFNPPAQACQEGAVRLVNGTIEQEGRVEVCIGGIWGSMCASAWRNPSANGFVVCNQLGFRGLSPSLISSQVSRFGAGSGPVFRGFDCQGWEQNISQCFSRNRQYDPTSSGSCNSNDFAGVQCSDFCSTGDVRLVGGPNSNSGIVQVCVNSLWGLIAEPGWSDTNAAVVCRQLQFSDEGAVAVNVSSRGFSRPTNAIHWSNVYCNGRENALSLCRVFTHSLSDGIELTGRLDVVGVSCPSGAAASAADTAADTARMISNVASSNVASTVFAAFTCAFLFAILLIAVIFLVCILKNKQQNAAMESVNEKPL